MPSPDIRAELAEVFAQARADIDAAERRALALLEARDGGSSDLAADTPKWISLDQGAAIRGVSRETMARHAERYGLGTCSGRRWRIDENRVRALNEGRPYVPLNPFPEG